MNKKELKELEEKQNELRRYRNDTIQQYKDYLGDIEATIRYYKINAMTDKFTYGRLNNDDKIKILRSYDHLHFLKITEQYTEEDKKITLDRAWDFLRLMVQADEEYNFWTKRKILDVKIDKDGLILDDIIWNKTQAKYYIKLAQVFGYTKFYYVDTSSAALKNITDFVDMGATVVGTCGKTGLGYEKAGLILDISNVDLKKVEEKEKEND